MNETLEELEQLVRTGRFDEVGERLRKLGKCARKDAAAIANIARRANQPALALRILNPIVRSEEVASPLEKIEYAEASRRLGAVHEAWKLLNEADDGHHPQATLYKIFCLFNQWKYEQALPLLQDYVLRKDLDEYSRLVGNMNFAAALVQVGRLEKASDLLVQIQKQAMESKSMLIYGNSLELYSQILVFRKEYDAAIRYLEESREVLKNAGSMFSLFPEKWLAIAESLKNNSVAPELRSVLTKAKATKHWETVRDCDMYIAYLDKDWRHLERIYFGTPFEGFRRRIRTLAGPQFQLGSSYLYSLTPNPPTVLNIASGRVDGLQTGRLPIGQSLHRFLILLAQDFYRPLLALSAFGQLFPGEYVNEISANRVHQVVKRCRLWISETGIDIQIEELDGGYRMILGEGLGLVLPELPLPMESKELEWLLITSAFGEKPFTIHEAKSVLLASTSNAQRFLRWAIESGRLQKEGKGLRTTYQALPTR